MMLTGQLIEERQAKKLCSLETAQRGQATQLFIHPFARWRYLRNFVSMS